MFWMIFSVLFILIILLIVSHSPMFREDKWLLRILILLLLVATFLTIFFQPKVLKVAEVTRKSESVRVVKLVNLNIKSLGVCIYKYKKTLIYSYKGRVITRCLLTEGITYPDWEYQDRLAIINFYGRNYDC